MRPSGGRRNGPRRDSLPYVGLTDLAKIFTISTTCLSTPHLQLIKIRMQVPKQRKSDGSLSDIDELSVNSALTPYKCQNIGNRTVLFPISTTCLSTPHLRPTSSKKGKFEQHKNKHQSHPNPTIPTSPQLSKR
jgi:hypothetical protein